MGLGKRLRRHWKKGGARDQYEGRGRLVPRKGAMGCGEEAERDLVRGWWVWMQAVVGEESGGCD